MQITGITQTQFRGIINTLNDTKYAANHIVIENMRDLSNTGQRITVKLGMSDSRGPGSRRSGSGRHGKWCSWQTFYDIMAGVFYYNPAARIASGMDTYKGVSDFITKTSHNFYTNVGSRIQPAYIGEMSVDWEFDKIDFNWPAYANGLPWDSGQVRAG